MLGNETNSPSLETLSTSAACGGARPLTGGAGGAVGSGGVSVVVTVGAVEDGAAGDGAAEGSFSGTATLFRGFEYFASASDCQNLYSFSQQRLTLRHLDLSDVVENSLHFLICDHLARAGENELTPSRHERVCFVHDLQQLGLHLLLRGQEAVPQVVADGPLLQQSLQGGFVFAYARKALHVGHGAADEGSFEESVGRGGVGLLQQSDIRVPLRMRGKPWLESFRWRTEGI